MTAAEVAELPDIKEALSVHAKGSEAIARLIPKQRGVPHDCPHCEQGRQKALKLGQREGLGLRQRTPILEKKEREGTITPDEAKILADIREIQKVLEAQKKRQEAKKGFVVYPNPLGQQMKCQDCELIFPNERYPQTVTKRFVTHFGKEYQIPDGEFFRSFRFSLFDAGTGNGIASALDYGINGGTKFSTGVRTTLSVGNLVFGNLASSSGTNPNPLLAQGDSSDIEVILTRTGSDDYDYSFDFGGLIATDSWADTGFEVTKFNAITLGVRNDAVNEYAVSNLSLDVTAIPEPSSVALLGLGMGALVFRRRRTRR